MTATMRRRLLRGLVGLLTAVMPALAMAQADLKPPVRLEADGIIIDTGPALGHSSPALEDIDGDGLKDLIVGDFSGKFRYYRNIGTKQEPKFTHSGNLQAGEVDAQVRIYCCIGSQPRFADLDDDGQRDLISNSYDPGHCVFFRRDQKEKFHPGLDMLDKAGVPVRSDPKQIQDFQSFGSFFTPVDWDGDGDLDLLIGCFSGELRLRINDGNAQQYQFATDHHVIHAGNEPLKVSAHCCPAVADWDGDGLWDLIVGSDDGSVTWFRNIGTSQIPQFAASQTLVENCGSNGYSLLRWPEDEVTTGIRAQVEVADLNGDGKMDLLVGDFCTALAPRPSLNADQRELLISRVGEIRDLEEKIGEQLKQIQRDFLSRYPGDAAFSAEATKEWQEVYKTVSESPESKQLRENSTAYFWKIRPLLAASRGVGTQFHNLAIPHGYVWFYERQ